MRYEPRYEKFGAAEPGGKTCTVEFRRAGFLTAGDRPELFFFLVDGAEAVVGISGEALKQFERGRRRLSREEKMDIAGLILKRKIEAGVALDSRNLMVREELLAELASELRLPE